MLKKTKKEENLSQTHFGKKNMGAVIFSLPKWAKSCVIFSDSQSPLFTYFLISSKWLLVYIASWKGSIGGKNLSRCMRFLQRPISNQQSNLLLRDFHFYNHFYSQKIAKGTTNFHIEEFQMLPQQGCSSRLRNKHDVYDGIKLSLQNMQQSKF